MKNLLVFFQLVSIIFIANNTNAEKMPIKFGEVSMDEVKMAKYMPDTTAQAVILCDYGSTIMRLNKGLGYFEITYSRTCRIKIFNENGYDWASGSFRIYNDIDIRENLHSIKGYTYNLVDDKIDRTKLTSNSIFRDELSDHWTEYKFTLPDVKAGSVIEFQYEFTSSQLGFLRPWDFQKEIPVIWSEYYVEIPEYYQYIKISTGYEPFCINETITEARTESVLYRTNSNRSGFEMRNSTLRNQTISYQAYIYHYAIKDLPAIKDEKFVGNVNDYKSRIEFQLSNGKLPG